MELGDFVDNIFSGGLRRWKMADSLSAEYSYNGQLELEVGPKWGRHYSWPVPSARLDQYSQLDGGGESEEGDSGDSDDDDLDGAGGGEAVLGSMIPERRGVPGATGLAVVAISNPVAVLMKGCVPPPRNNNTPPEQQHTSSYKTPRRCVESGFRVTQGYCGFDRQRAWGRRGLAARPQPQLHRGGPPPHGRF